jgi:thioredoxin 1
MRSTYLPAATALMVVLGTVGCAATGGAPSIQRTAAPAATARPTAVVPATAAPASLYDEEADAHADVAAAFAAAKADGKRVLLDFGADWCPDCHVLAAHLESANGRAMIERSFHVVRIDVGYWDHNLDVAEQFGSPIDNGIPAVVVLEADRTIVGSSADGFLANARVMTEKQVLDYLAPFALP